MNLLYKQCIQKLRILDDTSAIPMLIILADAIISEGGGETVFYASVFHSIREKTISFCALYRIF